LKKKSTDSRKSKSTVLRKPCTHLAGEYFVAAELSKRGFNVAMTVGNAKKVDLIIEDDGVTLPIQVKAIAYKRYIGWPIGFDAEFDRHLMFVFVILGDLSMPPEYFILNGAEVMSERRKYKTRAILNIYSVKDRLGRWDLIEERLSSLRRSRLRG
jgi:hypothetical protein